VFFLEAAIPGDIFEFVTPRDMQLAVNVIGVNGNRREENPGQRIIKGQKKIIKGLETRIWPEIREVNMPQASSAVIIQIPQKKQHIPLLHSYIRGRSF
jgi:hypothetical protein